MFCLLLILILKEKKSEAAVLLVWVGVSSGQPLEEVTTALPGRRGEADAFFQMALFWVAGDRAEGKK